MVASQGVLGSLCRWNPGQTGEAEVDARQGFLDSFCRGPTNRCLGLEWASARESQGALYRGCFGEVDGTEVSGLGCLRTLCAGGILAEQLESKLYSLGLFQSALCLCHLGKTTGAVVKTDQH